MAIRRTEPTATDTTGDACCEACVARSTVPRPTTSRAADRRITFRGLLVAAGFLVLALLGLAHLVVGRSGLWIPLHLALAGGASTAVAAVLPFFTAALAAAAPVDPRIRGLGVGGVAGGALVVSIAVPIGLTGVAVAGGLAYVAGIGAVAAAALLPLRGALGVRRPIIEVAYALALAQVGVGVMLAIGLIAGLAPIAERWALLKPAHGWLNVFGFLTVVIAATLLHLAPTVVGGRLRPRRSAIIAIIGLVAGPPLVAFGLVLASDVIVRAGAALELIGAMALVLHAVHVYRDRGRWTSDSGWHRFTGWSLLVAPGWLLVAVVVAGGPLLWLGADPAAWSLSRLAVPLAIGFVGQVLVGSWSHLIPAIGPGDQAAHARQRRILGRLAVTRSTALNVGALLAASGVALADVAPMVQQPLIGSGLAIAGASLASAVMLLAAAAWTGRPEPAVAAAS